MMWLINERRTNRITENGKQKMCNGETDRQGVICSVSLPQELVDSDCAVRSPRWTQWTLRSLQFVFLCGFVAQESWLASGKTISGASSFLRLHDAGTDHSLNSCELSLVPLYYLMRSLNVVSLGPAIVGLQQQMHLLPPSPLPSLCSNASCMHIVRPCMGMVRHSGTEHKPDDVWNHVLQACRIVIQRHRPASYLIWHSLGLVLYSSYVALPTVTVIAVFFFFHPSPKTGQITVLAWWANVQ